MGFVGMIGVEVASGLKRRGFPTEFSRLVSTDFSADLFSPDMPPAGGELETLRLLLTEEIDDDDADEEVEEEEFRLRRLVFELPVCMGLLLRHVSAGPWPCWDFTMGTLGNEVEVDEGVESRTCFADAGN